MKSLTLTLVRGLPAMISAHRGYDRVESGLVPYLSSPIYTIGAATLMLEVVVYRHVELLHNHDA